MRSEGGGDQFGIDRITSGVQLAQTADGVHGFSIRFQRVLTTGDCDTAVPVHDGQVRKKVLAVASSSSDFIQLCVTG